jgi:hypothetical protein
MNTIPNRLVIYTKDVMNITGRKERTAQKLLAQIRAHYQKSKEDFITLSEFCTFTGLKEEQVLPFLK